MLEYFKKKSVGCYVNLCAAIFGLAMVIVYSTFTSRYGLLNGWAVACLCVAIVLDVLLFLVQTKVDEYLKVITSCLSAIALGLFFVACVGDISDYINNLNFMGTGAPISTIITITVLMFVLVIVQIAACFFGKKKN